MAGNFACKNKLSCARVSVVSVLPLWPDNARNNEEPEGSGIALGDGTLVATADHVIGPATKVYVRTVEGEVLESQIVLRDPASDIALLRLDQLLPVFVLSANTEVGTRACALGNGFGLDISVTCGVISALHMSGVGFNQIEDFIQTDATVNPGMSGGALVNENGELIGMLSAIFTKKSDANIGVNFAVSAELLRRVVDDFSTAGKLQRIAPGILVRPSLKPGMAGVTGLQIVRLEPDSPEARAGLLQGDVIITVNGRRTKRAGAYRAALALLAQGAKASVEILRAGNPQSIQIEFN